VILNAKKLKSTSLLHKVTGAGCEQGQGSEDMSIIYGPGPKDGQAAQKEEVEAG